MNVDFCESLNLGLGRARRFAAHPVLSLLMVVVPCIVDVDTSGVLKM